MAQERKPPEKRNSYFHFRTMPTRWMDNDQYSHVNNVVYYSFFDTLLNRYLVDEGGFDFNLDPIIGIAVETQCRFHKSFAYPEDIQGGLRIGHLGKSSVRYEIGLFAAGEDDARADGHFIHVFVERETNKPTELPEQLRAALERIKVR
jgi:acyl-CoA thioester hydrolase